MEIQNKITWKKELRDLEKAKKWDEAIDYLKDVIWKYPDDVDPYIFMNFLLMNLLVEEEHNEEKHGFYESLAKHYFAESYAKFKDNTEYLFFTAWTANMSEWFFNIHVKDYQQMFEKSQRLDPENLLYRYNYYLSLDKSDPTNNKKIRDYASKILQDDSIITNELHSKGALGEYLLMLMTNWSLRQLGMKS